MQYYFSVGSDEKLTARFLSGQNITVADCDKILISHGYQLHKKSGSHNTYHLKGGTPISIPTPKNSKYVNPVYVKLIIKYLKLEG